MPHKVFFNSDINKKINAYSFKKKKKKRKKKKERKKKLDFTENFIEKYISMKMVF